MLVRPHLWMTLLAMSGCYKFTYTRLEPNGHNPVAVDLLQPHTATRISYLWGLVPAREHAPEEPAACDGLGAGKVELIVPLWGQLTTLVTLGIVMPAEVRIFCTTDPDVGCRGLTGPAGPP